MILHLIVFSDSGFPLCYVRIQSLFSQYTICTQLLIVIFCFFVFLPGVGHPLIIGAKDYISDHAKKKKKNTTPSTALITAKKEKGCYKFFNSPIFSGITCVVSLPDQYGSSTELIRNDLMLYLRI